MGSILIGFGCEISRAIASSRKTFFFAKKVRIFVRRIADDASGRFKNEKGELEAERTESIVRKGTILS